MSKTGSTESSILKWGHQLKQPSSHSAPPPPWAGTKGVISREASGVAPDLELWDACCEVNVYSPLRFTRDPWSWFLLFVQFIARELMFAQRFGNRSLFFLLQKLTNFEEVTKITVHFCKIVVYVKFQWMGPMCTAAAAHGPYNHSLQLFVWVGPRTDIVRMELKQSGANLRIVAEDKFCFATF